MQEVVWWCRNGCAGLVQEKLVCCKKTWLTAGGTGQLWKESGLLQKEIALKRAGDDFPNLVLIRELWLVGSCTIYWLELRHLLLGWLVVMCHWLLFLRPWSDRLVSYPGHSLGESYPSAEKQSMYSTASDNWAMFREEVSLGSYFKNLFSPCGQCQPFKKYLILSLIPISVYSFIVSVLHGPKLFYIGVRCFVGFA